MKFGEKLRACRKGARLTQEELASRLGLAKRTVEGYESGAFYPRDREVYDKLAALFQMDKDYFLTENDAPADGKKTAEEVLTTARALFAGGEMSEEDKDTLARALMDAYWMAKRKSEARDGV